MASNSRHAAFLREFPKDFNATQAAIRAGYSKNGASVQGSRLLANPKIRLALANSASKAAEKADVSLERWVAAVADDAFVKQPTDDFKHDHRLKARDMLGRHLGAYQNEKASTVQAFQININIDDKDRE